MSININTRNLITWFGRGLMVFGLVFVLRRILLYRSVIEKDVLSLRLWVAILICSSIYAVSCFLLSFGWLLLLRAQGVGSSFLPLKNACSLYGKTQIAKYVPGNVFHFAGRHLSASQFGVKHKSLAFAAVGEICFLLIAALILSVFAAPAIFRFLQVPVYLLSLFVLLAVCFGAVLLVYAGKKGFLRGFTISKIKDLFYSQMVYMLFLVVACSLFFFVMRLQDSSSLIGYDHFPFILGVYAFAWALGFVVPGAPGGVGVKEFVLLALLSVLFPENVILLAVVMFRFVTIFGDCIFYFISTFLTNHFTDFGNEKGGQA